MTDPLAGFALAVRAWFSETFDRPTPPQVQGWPPIQRGENTLLLAPTGSGKTLAAFLWGIDRLFTKLAEGEEPKGVELLYISPLKALNNDIERNLRVPLRGIRRVSERDLGVELPRLRVAVRTGDTPRSARQAMIRQPPHVLITTPESFYLLLTSPRAREMFRSVRTVILDEIHTLCGNKRGVHLALSLERLEHLAEGPIQRIGLSATIRPLEEVARFLGGYCEAASQRGMSNEEWGRSNEEGETRDEVSKARIGEGTENSTSLVDSLPIDPSPIDYHPRPVTIVDAEYEKPLDLKVITVAESFHNLPGGSIWPSVIPRVLDLIRQHHTTLIFCNSRRLAERTSDRLNDQIAAETSGRTEEGWSAMLTREGVPQHMGMSATGMTQAPIRAHHGSMSREVRLQMEADLKAGRLPALVGTSSLELGIDIGSIDLVVQLQSPKSVAQGLQRVGRSGHLVGQTSKGRLFATHREDLMEAAAVAGGMLRGEVEATYTPRNCLDVLSQQVVAMASVEMWDLEELYALVRRAYPYQNLSRRAFTSVLHMLAGKYPSRAFRELRPRIAWDPVQDQISALPGSRIMALTNGGTIPNRGSFGAYLSDGRTKIGELDEEFVFETREGDVFVLGSQVWRAVKITDDRVMVVPAPGAPPRLPFWRGDLPWRPYELGERIGQFRWQVAERMQEREVPPEELLQWLQRNYALDRNSAHNVLDYVGRQLDAMGAISSDRMVIVESFPDALGDPRMVVHSPFGGKVNGPWGLALAAVLRERTGVDVEVLTNDDGIIFRFPEADVNPPLDVVAGLTPQEGRERLLQELPNSALFGAQFRMNAQRALLLPGTRPGKRTPFWLQRLRAKDLLQVVERFDGFPILAETYRDCLREVMDWPHLEELLGKIQGGEIEVLPVETAVPSPVAAGLLFDFINIYMYEWDTPKAERQLQALALNRELLADLLEDVDLAELLRPEAVREVSDRVARRAPTTQARSVEELAWLLGEMGDLTTPEVEERTTGDGAAWLDELAHQGRVLQVPIPTPSGLDHRWISAERYPLYRDAFDLAQVPPIPIPERLLRPHHGPEEARGEILRSFLVHSGLVTIEEIQARYEFPVEWLEGELDHLIESREVARGRFQPDELPAIQPEGRIQVVDRRNLEQIHRRTLTLLRREVQPVPLSAYAAFLARWQHLHPHTQLSGARGLRQVLQQLRAVPVVGPVWERDVLPGRLRDFDPAQLEALCQSGELVWVGSGGKDPRRSRVRFLFRGEGSGFLEWEPPPQATAELGEAARGVWDLLRAEGACFFADLQAGLEMRPEVLREALTELVLAGIVTNDTLQALREILAQGGLGVSTPPPPSSALEVQLTHRLEPSSRHRRTRYRRAKRRVVQRVREQLSWVGRWSLTHRLGVMGKPVSDEERILRQARQLLNRYGVVTRAALENEEGQWDWGDLYPRFRLMEMRGEVRRGYFVEGLSGLQFALPEVVEGVRDAAKPPGVDEPLVVMSSCDPANLFGLQEVGGPMMTTGKTLRFSRLPSTYLVLHHGWPVLLAEGNGTALTTSQGTDEGVIRRALGVLLPRLASVGRGHRVTVQRWNGEGAIGSPGQLLLESAGAVRGYGGMEWERK
jgi:ATP-dependent Lhr-like helicase